MKVNEKKPFFYINNEKKYYVFSEDAKLIDIKDSMADLEVPEVVGLELGDIKLGESIVFNKDNKRKVKYISDLFLNISNPIDDSFDKIIAQQSIKNGLAYGNIYAIKEKR